MDFKEFLSLQNQRMARLTSNFNGKLPRLKIYVWPKSQLDPRLVVLLLGFPYDNHRYWSDKLLAKGRRAMYLYDCHSHENRLSADNQFDTCCGKIG